MLCLTPRKSNAPVFVPANVVQKLSPVDISSVRHMYEQCFIKGNHCVLNHDKEMNQPRQIHALLTAVKPCKPSLIVCQRTSLSKWCYELSVGLNIILASEITGTTKLTNINVVLVPHDQLKFIKSTLMDEWFLFVVDDIEVVIKSRFIKNVDVDFRIAITNRNFLLHPDDELQWDILKWTNPALVESKDRFIQSNKVVKRHLLRPFPVFWHRLSWALFDNLKPTSTSAEAYEADVKVWCKLHLPKALILPDVKKARTTRRNTSKKLKHTLVMPKRRARKKYIKQENIAADIGSKETDVSDQNNSSREMISSAKRNTKRLAFDSSDDDVTDIENRIDTNRVSASVKVSKYSAMLDEEDPILNSLFMEDNPPSQHSVTKDIDTSDTEEYPVEETVAKHAQITDDICTNMAVDNSTNLILDSLVDSPEPVGKTEMSDDEDTCAILDLLL